jgi:acyl-CoA thioester hydrolase
VTTERRVRARRAHRSWEPQEDFLESHEQVRVRFQEVDSLRVAWHGHYLSYFEEGRHGFGREFGFGYQNIYDEGYTVPLVHLELDYLRPSRFQELLNVRTRLHLVPGARLVFAYLITGETGDVKVGGHTVQAFTDLNGELVVCRPAFYEAFLERWKGAAQAL